MGTDTPGEGRNLEPVLREDARGEIGGLAQRTHRHDRASTVELAETAAEGAEWYVDGAGAWQRVRQHQRGWPHVENLDGGVVGQGIYGRDQTIAGVAGGEPGEVDDVLGRAERRTGRYEAGEGL